MTLTDSLIEFLKQSDTVFKLYPYQENILRAVMDNNTKLIHYTKQIGRKEAIAASIAIALVIGPRFKVKMDVDMARRVKMYLHQFKQYGGAQ